MPVALSVARRVHAVRRFIRATLKAPFEVPSWVTNANDISSIQQAREARDSYEPRKRHRQQTWRGGKWRKLHEAAELEERKVRGLMEQVLRVHLASPLRLASFLPAVAR